MKLKIDILKFSLKSRLLSLFSDDWRFWNVDSFDSGTIKDVNQPCQFKLIINSERLKRICFIFCSNAPWNLPWDTFQQRPNEVQLSCGIFRGSSGAQKCPAPFSIMLLRTGGLLGGHQVYLGLKLERAGARLAVLATCVIRS